MTNSTELDVSALMSIAAVERDCGLAKDTLRVWERRYGFPQPLRDAHDERRYPADQVAKLRLLRRLIDAGYRPGKIVGHSTEDLSALLRGLEAHGSEPESPAAREVLARLAAHDAERLRDFLASLLTRMGLRAFAAEIAPQLAYAVGAAWARGELEIHQEHLFTEHFTTVLRGAINAALAAGAPRDRPRVLLSTLPQEPHALGLLMAEAMFVLEGCRCISLGVQTPAPDIATAARAHGADILALSFSAMANATQAQAGLAELRAATPAATEIWAGGACPGLRAQPGVVLVKGLDAIGPAVTAWRLRAGPGEAPR